MTPERWHRIQELLDRALERPESEREGFLADACAGDPDLAREVRSLLEQDHPDSFLESPAAGEAGAPSFLPEKADVESLVGRDVGPYRVLREIGRGGMGVVYEALQRRPVERRVALKLVKWGMDTRQVIARFESERQALALMSHPSIAAVHEAGATERGRPWFAMEHVSGVPITEYCDTHRLSIPRRLDLFIRVCDAIQHAHQKGIIHRDIKPPNVLVTLKDATPLPKVIDFGVAKATAQRLTEKTLYTELGQLIGTPSYMSPEQAEMTGLDIDTRSDVYSLGALLYELLAGSQPFDSTELRKAGIEEIRRRIREEDPPAPSARILASGQGDAVAEKRGLPDARVLAREVRGDLDRIVAKALAKDRTQRYGTASELGEDVTRHLLHEPVRASPPSAAYRLGKFARRHRAGVVSGAVAALALVLGMAGTTLGLVRARRAEREARREAAKAEAVNEFMQETLGAANPEEGLGRRATVVEALEAAVDKVDESFADQPLIEAAVRHTIGATFRPLGRAEEAREQLERSLAIRERLLGPDHDDIAETLGELATVHGELLGDPDTALSISRRSLEMLERLHRGDHEEIATQINNIGNLLFRKGDLDAAAARSLDALNMFERVLGRAHKKTLTARLNLGVIRRRQGRYDEAVRLNREALEVLSELPHPIPTQEGLAHNNLGRLLESRGDLTQALEHFRTSVELAVNTWGPRHWRTGHGRGNYGGCLTRLGRYEEAEEQLLSAVEILRGTVGDHHNSTQQALRNIVALYEAWGRPQEAGRYRPLLIERPSASKRLSPP